MSKKENKNSTLSIVITLDGKEYKVSADMPGEFISDLDKYHGLSFLDSLDLMYKTIRSEMVRSIPIEISSPK